MGILNNNNYLDIRSSFSVKGVEGELVVISNKCHVCLIRCRNILQHTFYTRYYLLNYSFLYCILRAFQCNNQVNILYFQVFQINRRSQYIVHPIAQLRPITFILSYTIYIALTEIKFWNFSRMAAKIAFKAVSFVQPLEVGVDIALASLASYGFVSFKVDHLAGGFAFSSICKRLYDDSKWYF